MTKECCFASLNWTNRWSAPTERNLINHPDFVVLSSGRCWSSGSSPSRPRRLRHWHGNGRTDERRSSRVKVIPGGSLDVRWRRSSSWSLFRPSTDDLYPCSHCVCRRNSRYWGKEASSLMHRSGSIVNLSLYVSQQRMHSPELVQLNLGHDDNAHFSFEIITAYKSIPFCMSSVCATTPFQALLCDVHRSTGGGNWPPPPPSSSYWIPPHCTKHWVLSTEQ